MKTEFDDFDFPNWMHPPNRIQLAEFLQSASVEERHAVALSWNYDQGYEAPAWICSRPDCDRGTAVRVLWGLHPEFGLEQILNGAELDGFFKNDADLITLIVNRALAGNYEIANLSSNGFPLDYEVHEYQQSLTKLAPEKQPWKIVAKFMGQVQGREVDLSGYQGGIPFVLQNRFYEQSVVENKTPQSELSSGFISKLWKRFVK